MRLLGCRRPWMALAVLLLAAPGCGRQETAGRPASGTSSSHGGRFIYPLRNEPVTLNFVAASDQTSDMVSRLVGDSLVDRDADLKVVPRLAESWQFSGDGRTLTFHLRTGVRFHDGHPLTSADVRYTYERII